MTVTGLAHSEVTRVTDVFAEPRSSSGCMGVTVRTGMSVYENMGHRRHRSERQATDSAEFVIGFRELRTADVR